MLMLVICSSSWLLWTHQLQSFVWCCYIIAITLLLCITLSLLHYIIISTLHYHSCQLCPRPPRCCQCTRAQWAPCKGRLFPQKWMNFPKKTLGGRGWMWWLFPIKNIYFLLIFCFFAWTFCFFKGVLRGRFQNFLEINPFWKVEASLIG